MIVVVGHQPGQEAPVIPLGGINIGGGGLTTDWLSPFILSNNLLLRPHKEGLPCEGEPLLPMCRLQEDDCLFVFPGRSCTPTSMRCFPFFGTGGNSSFRDDRCCAFRNGTDPNENEVLFFFSPFPVVFFNLCGFKRKLHTAEGCGRFSCYLSVKVVFKKIISLPLRPAL